MPLDLAALMEIPLKEARKAAAAGEVPIGAAIFTGEGELLAAAGNLKESSGDPTAHAETLAIRAAAAKVGNWRLEKTILISTVEPCPLCLGAAIQARIPRIVFGCRDEKFGALGSVVDLREAAWNHHFSVEEGIRAEEARELLQKFFRARRG